MTAGPVIDAEFLETPPAPGPTGPRPTEGYGRRTVAGASSAADAVADVLEASGPLLDTAAGVTEAVGGEGAAKRVRAAADVARAGAEVARAVPVAVEGFKREAAPLVSAWGKLVSRAKASGVIGERRAPREVERVMRVKKSEAR